MDDNYIKPLGEILRKAQGRIDAETGETIDIGDEVQRLRNICYRLQVDSETLKHVAEQSQPVPEWQPVSTAPKDGSAILAWAEGTTTTVYWDEGLESWELCQCGAFADSGEFWPQYWMPLPAAPKPGGESD